MGRPPVYSIVSETDEAMTIRDVCHGDHLSVTNGAEYVVEQLAPILGTRRLFYYDTEGQLDELLVKDGKFAGFAPGPR